MLSQPLSELLSSAKGSGVLSQSLSELLMYGKRSGMSSSDSATRVDICISLLHCWWLVFVWWPVLLSRGWHSVGLGSSDSDSEVCTGSSRKSGSHMSSQVDSDPESEVSIKLGGPVLMLSACSSRCMFCTSGGCSLLLGCGQCELSLHARAQIMQLPSLVSTFHPTNSSLQRLQRGFGWMLLLPLWCTSVQNGHKGSTPPAGVW